MPKILKTEKEREKKRRREREKDLFPREGRRKLKMYVRLVTKFSLLLSSPR